MTRKKLLTWAGRSKFEYSGSVKSGTDIYFGKAFRYHEFISTKKYQMLLDFFIARTVSIGTSRTNPPNGSVGLMVNGKRFSKSIGFICWSYPFI